MNFITFFALSVLAPVSVHSQPLFNDVPGAEHEWTELAPIAGGPRQEHAVAAVGTDVYIIGGIPAISPNATSVPTLDKVEVYSIPKNEWHDAASVPIAVNHGNVATVNGKIYLLGGLSGGDIWQAFGDCFEYDPLNDSWSTLPPMPDGQARGASAMGVRGSTIYIAGGLLELDVRTGAQPSVDTVSSYDTETQVWTTLPSLPEGRDHVGGAVVDDTFYVIGGRINGVQNVRSTVFALDLDSPDQGWVEKAAMLTARGGISTGQIGSMIYTFGGEGSRDVVNGIFNETEAYDTECDSWTRLPPMPFPRHGTNAVAVGGGIYVPGGGNMTGAGSVDTNDVFRPEVNT